MRLRFSIPSEFTDEDKWKIWQISLSKLSMLALVIGLGITWMLHKLLTPLGGSVVGVVIGLIITLILVLITAIPVSETEYLKGAGILWYEILLRRFIRRRKSVIYVRGYGSDIKERRK